MHRLVLLTSFVLMACVLVACDNPDRPTDPYKRNFAPHPVKKPPKQEVQIVTPEESPFPAHCDLDPSFYPVDVYRPPKFNMGDLVTLKTELLDETLPPKIGIINDRKRYIKKFEVSGAAYCYEYEILFQTPDLTYQKQTYREYILCPYPTKEKQK